MMDCRDYAAMCGGAKKPSVTIEHDDCDEVIELPIRWAVCPVCKGRGTHVNPSIDAHGISPDEFAADPDFAEDYFGGAYDVQCANCGGRTTIPEVDEDRADPELLALYLAHQKEESEWRAIQAAERAMGY
jgi:hypothetical protein